MKSIEDTLSLIDKIVSSLAEHDTINIALVGGYAVIAYGIKRTTKDIDTLAISPYGSFGKALSEFLKYELKSKIGSHLNSLN